MRKRSKFIKIASFGSILLVSSIIAAQAENIPGSGSHKNLGNLSEKIVDSSQFQSHRRLDHQRSNSDQTFKQLTSNTVAQASDSTKDATADIIKPAQESISNTDKLNPSANPLSFPTQPEEVKVDLQKPITLEQAIELSLKNNKQIEEARIQIERAEAVVRGSRAAYFPSITLGSALNYSNSAFLDSPIEQSIQASVDDVIEANPGVSEAEATAVVEDSFNTTSTSSANFTFNTDVTLNYSIYDGGARNAAINRDEKLLKTQKLALEQIVEETRLETSSNYYDLQNSDAQVKIEAAAVADAGQTLKDARLLERAGLGTRFDVLRAEVELAQAQQRKSTAKANQNIARRQLANTLSVSHSTDLSTADAIEEVGTWSLSLPESIVQAFQNRAELEQLLLQREIGAEQRKLALSAIRPTIATSATYGVNDDFEDNFDLSDQYSVGLNLQWNVFDGGAASASAQQADKDIEIAETQFAAQRNAIRFAVEQAYFGLESNKRNIGTATKEVELAEESLRLARLRFQAGVGTQTDVIEAQTQLTTARGNLLSSIIEYNQSYTDLQRQISNTPDNGLQDLP